LAISDITLLQLATLASKDRIQLDISLESFSQEVESRFTVLPMSGRVCARAKGLPRNYPKDPSDRIIGATDLSSLRASRSRPHANASLYDVAQTRKCEKQIHVRRIHQPAEVHA
jgi:hypothetical protein